MRFLFNVSVVSDGIGGSVKSSPSLFESSSSSLNFVKRSIPVSELKLFCVKSSICVYTDASCCQFAAHQQLQEKRPAHLLAIYFGKLVRNRFQIHSAAREKLLQRKKTNKLAFFWVATSVRKSQPTSPGLNISPSSKASLASGPSVIGLSGTRSGLGWSGPWSVSPGAPSGTVNVTCRR